MKIEINEKANGWVVSVHTVDVMLFQKLCDGHRTTIHPDGESVVKRITELMEKMEVKE